MAPKDGAFSMTLLVRESQSCGLVPHFIADDHIVHYSPDRTAIAGQLDAKLRSWQSTIAQSGTDAQKAAMAKLCE